MEIPKIIEKLAREHTASSGELLAVIESHDSAVKSLLYSAADRLRREYYGTDVFIRGLIEFTNFCGNDCFYCGIRCSNRLAERYRLSEDEIFSCCENGYLLGFRTFVLQGGEDAFFTDERICGIVSKIKESFPDCAVTLSIGEKPYASYKKFFDAGADRYLLRHETANTRHYSRLHPAGMTLESRKDCLFALKEIGFQVGAGFMVGSPFQTEENLVEDLLFLSELSPHMVGIGPFVPHKDTPFADFAAGGLEETLTMVALTRLLLPAALIPSTTALGTISTNGRILGLKAGANVVMPNLSPLDYRKKYALYDNKISTNEEAAEGKSALEAQVSEAGYRVVVGRGDCKTAYNKLD